MMASTQVVVMSVSVTLNSPSEDNTFPDDMMLLLGSNHSQKY